MRHWFAFAEGGQRAGKAWPGSDPKVRRPVGMF